MAKSQVDKKLRDTKNRVEDDLDFGKGAGAADFPKPPRHLDDVGKKLWYDEGLRLWKLTIVQRSDLKHLEVLCSAYSRWQRAVDAFERSYEEDGAEKAFLETRDTGVTIIHPLLNVIAKQEQACMKAFAQLGMTPVSRAKMVGHAPKPPPSDPKSKAAEKIFGK